MLDLTMDPSDTALLADFRRNPDELLDELQRTGRPVTLTVNGTATAVLQSADAYQRLLDLAAQADIHEAIRQGDEDVQAGRLYDVADAFAAIRKAHGVPS